MLFEKGCINYIQWELQRGYQFRDSNAVFVTISRDGVGKASATAFAQTKRRRTQEYENYEGCLPSASKGITF